MSILIERLFAVHDALDNAGIPHAVGGAIALAYCTKNPRGTRDLDLNIFLGVDAAEEVLAALPAPVGYSSDDVEKVREVGQVRLWWGETPVDLFFNNLPLHEDVAAGKVLVQLEGKEIPVLDAASLVIFKAMFDRTKDWADIEEIFRHDPDAVAKAATKVSDLIGVDDHISRRLNGMVGQI